jgi:hypothetical protein
MFLVRIDFLRIELEYFQSSISCPFIHSWDRAGLFVFFLHDIGGSSPVTVTTEKTMMKPALAGLRLSPHWLEFAAVSMALTLSVHFECGSCGDVSKQQLASLSLRFMEMSDYQQRTTCEGDCCFVVLRKERKVSAIESHAKPEVCFASTRLPPGASSQKPSTPSHFRPRCHHRWE